MHLVIGTVLLVSVVTVLVAIAGYVVDRSTTREEVSGARHRTGATLPESGTVVPRGTGVGKE